MSTSTRPKLLGRHTGLVPPAAITWYGPGFPSAPGHEPGATGLLLGGDEQHAPLRREGAEQRGTAAGPRTPVQPPPPKPLGRRAAVARRAIWPVQRRVGEGGAKSRRPAP